MWLLIVAILVVLIPSQLHAVDFLGVTMCEAGAGGINGPTPVSVLTPGVTQQATGWVSNDQITSLVVLVKSADMNQATGPESFKRLEALISDAIGEPDGKSEGWRSWHGEGLTVALTRSEKENKVNARCGFHIVKDPNKLHLPTPTGAPMHRPTKIVEVEDFEIVGDLKISPSVGNLVKVMGLLRNNSGKSYSLANFDLSLFKGEELLCVGTVTIRELKRSQERGFSELVDCPGYSSAGANTFKFQFAGGY